MPKRGNYHYQWRHNNRFELLVDGAAFYPHMLEAIDHARHFILLEQYIFKSGEIASLFIDRLCAAADRDVGVHLILDHFGSIGLRDTDHARLRQHKVEVVFYNPMRLHRRSLFRDHRKLLIIDSQCVYTGGAGIHDELLATSSKPASAVWHDVMLCIHGPVIEDWIELFRDNWSNITGQSIHLKFTKPIANAGEEIGKVIIAASLAKQEVQRALINRIRRAKQRVWITSPYFLTTWKLRRTLRRAARLNLDVRLILPGARSDQPWISHAVRRLYTRLLRNGVRIYEFQPRFSHSKIQLVDNWVSIGSSNLDRWNQYWNLDANQSVISNHLANRVEQLLLSNMEQSVEINLANWRQRGWRQRLAEWLSAQMVRILTMLGQRR